MTEAGEPRWASAAVGTGDMAVLEVVPPSPRGAVVVLHEAWGVTPYTVDVARRLAADGHHVVAPDLLHRDPEPHPIPYGQLDRLLPAVRRMRDDDVLDDLDAVRERLAVAGWDHGQMAVLGFCLGGRFALLGALRRAWGAAVAFYPGGIVTAAFGNLPPLVDEVPGLRAPWLGLFGDDDETIPVDDVERLRDALAPVEVDTDVVRYPGVGHAFHNDHRPSHAPDAADDAWGRAVGWLERHLPPSGHLPTGW